ncbi:N/A [soil metagenome]
MFQRLLPCSFVIALLVGCNANSGGISENTWGDAKSPKVICTFAPIQCFAINVVGDHGTVKGILSTQGPHHADPPANQARLLSQADVFFSNGLKVDDSVVRKMTDAMGKTGVKATKLGGSIPPSLLLEGTCSCCKDEEGSDHGDHKEIDGHVWLGIDQAKVMVETMATTLDTREGKTANYSNAAKVYIDKLDKLQADGKAMLKDKKERTILPFHGSLRYFAKSFDLELIDPIQDVPGQEPTAKQLDAIVAKCLKNKVRVIAVEPQYGASNSAKTVLNELKRRGMTDAELVVIDPLETATDGEMNADWYVTKMRANLEALAKVLK